MNFSSAQIFVPLRYTKTSDDADTLYEIIKSFYFSSENLLFGIIFLFFKYLKVEVN